jgi:hypothetical protein
MESVTEESALIGVTPDTEADETPGFAPGLVAILGMSGSILIALASNLPGSPFGPGAAGLWPLSAAGPAPRWEGPILPTWAKLSDQASTVGGGRLLPTMAVIVGAGLLVLGWCCLWRRARAMPDLRPRTIWLIVGTWITPLLLSAPFASQDGWHYGADGKAVLDGLPGYQPASLIGHSVWALGVDAQWATRPSLYGPGALDLSALFVKMSGGRPWVAAECWRVTAIIGIALCAWGVKRIVSLLRADSTTATVAGVANPAVLIILVGGIHNDALMLGLTVAGIALVMSRTGLWGTILCALGLAVKPNALLALGALAWWCWGSRWRERVAGLTSGSAAAVGVLFVSGLGVGGGFGWVRSVLSYAWVPGPWSLGPRFLGVQAGRPIEVIEMAGTALAVLFVIGMGRSGRWIAGLGWGFATLAITTPTPEPWYLAWAVVLLACGGLNRRSERVGVLVLGVMMLGSVIPPGPFWWFSGEVVLAWLALVALRARFPRGAGILPVYRSRMTTGI